MIGLAFGILKLGETNLTCWQWLGLAATYGGGTWSQ